MSPRFRTAACPPQPGSRRLSPGWLRRHVGALGAIVLVTTTAACGSESAADGGADKITVAIYGKHASYWPLYIAEEQGFFEDEGLTIDLIVPQAGSGITQSVMSGSVQIGIGTPDGFILAKDQGQAVSTFASLQNLPIGSLMVDEGTDYPAGVKGEIVAVSNEKSGDAYLTASLLKDAGLTADDFQYLAAGGTPDRAAALSSGGVKAALIGQPQDFALMRQGFKRVGLADDVVKDFAWQWMSAEDKWADKNVDSVESFLHAIQKATEWWYDPANADAAIDLLARVGSADPADAKSTYELWQEKAVFQRDLVASEAAFEGIIDFMRATEQLDGEGDPTYEDFVNLEVVESLGAK